MGCSLGTGKSADELDGLASLQSVKETYTLRRKIGAGQFGEVFEGIHKETGVAYAIKKINKQRVKNMENIKKEMEFLLCVNHPNIVNVVDLIEDKISFYIVQDFLCGEELLDRIAGSTNGICEKEVARVIGQVLSGVAHCHHEVGIAHRDLKPENIMFKTTEKDSEIVIIDFGLSETVSTNMSTSQELKDAQHDHLSLFCGTPYYMAPEVWELSYSRSCDIWSVGVMMYLLICGKLPFDGNNIKQLQANIMFQPLNFESEEWGHVHKSAKNFLMRLLEKNPAKRPSALEALDDPWFRELHVETHEVGKQIQSRLGIFHSMNKLKKMAAVVIVEEGTITETAEMMTMFKELDTHNTGYISRDELRAGLTQMKTKNQDVDYDVMLHEISQSDADAIDYTMFLAAAIRPTVRGNDHNVKIAFDFFDTDKDGFITAKNLVEIIGSEAQARMLIGEADLNHEQRISFEEFTNMMVKPDFKTLLSDKHISDQKIKLIANEWAKPDKDSMEQKLYFKQATTGILPLGLKADVLFKKPNEVMVVHYVDHNSLAERAGVKPLQILLKVDDVSANEFSKESLLAKIEQAAKEHSGCTVTVGVLPSNHVFQRAIGHDVESVNMGELRRRASVHHEIKIEKEAEPTRSLWCY